MKAVKTGNNPGDSGVAILTSNEFLLRAVEQVVAQSLHLVHLSPEDSVRDILAYLARLERPELLCLDTDLTFKGGPSEPGLAAAYFGQHVRLSECLGSSTLTGILFVLHHSLEYYLSQSPENIFLLSPGCKSVIVCNLLSALHHGWRSTEQLNASELRFRLSPYLLETERMRQVSAHQYRNLAGIGKLMREFAYDVRGIDHPELAAYRQTLEEDLLFKRRSFLSDPRVADEVCTEPELSQLRTVCRGLRFVLIDDEHERGWSTALFSGLFGDIAELDQPKGGAEVTSYGGGRLLCIKSFNSASSFIDVHKQTLESALRVWSNADKWNCEKEEEARSASDEHSSLEAGLRNALKVVEPFRASIAGLQKQVLESRELLATVAPPILESIADRFTTPKSVDDPLAEALSAEKPVSELHNALSSYLDRLRRLTEGESKLKNLESDLQHRQKLVESSREKLHQARNRQHQADSSLQSAALRLANSFSYSVIFLDLRIDPEANATDATGIQHSLTLLKSLKEFFPFIPVIVFTASSQATNLATTKAMGADRFWIKQQLSGRELLRGVLDCLRKREFHRIWLDLQKVKARSRLTCYRWQNDPRKPIALRYLAKGDRDRVIIEDYLNHICRSLFEAIESDAVVRDSIQHACREVILDLGFLQEMRYDGVEKEAWRRIGSTEELKWRELRNSVTHKGTGTELDDALEFLRFTIRRLLV